MEYRAAYSNEKTMVILKITGELNPSLIAEPLMAAARLLMKNNCSMLLSDLRDTFSTSTIVQTYHLPDIFKQIGFQHHLCQALVVRKLYKTMRFAETVCMNRSWKMRAFTDPEDAQDWLLRAKKDRSAHMSE